MPLCNCSAHLAHLLFLAPPLITHTQISDLVGYLILYASISLTYQADEADSMPPQPQGILPLTRVPPRVASPLSVPLEKPSRFAVLSARLPYGWKRADIVGAFFNGAFLIAVGLSIILQATERFVDRRGGLSVASSIQWSGRSD